MGGGFIFLALAAEVLNGNHDGLHNLVWVWDAVPPAFGPNTSGQFGDFFPGLLYVDALALDLPDFNGRFRSDRFLSEMALGKVIGLGITGKIPDSALFAQHTNWAWFLVSPEALANQRADQSAALLKLYPDPRVVSRSHLTNSGTSPK